MHVAVIGGYNNNHNWYNKISLQPPRQVEVIRIKENGAVSSSNCHVPPLNTIGAKGTGLLICGGGTWNTRIKNECYELNFNASKLNWIKRKEMKEGRRDPLMISLNNGTVFACGGVDIRYNESVSCERYDDGKWRYIEGPPIPIFLTCMVGTDDALFLFGNDRKTGRKSWQDQVGVANINNKRLYKLKRYFLLLILIIFFLICSLRKTTYINMTYKMTNG